MGKDFNADYLRELAALDEFLGRRRGPEPMVEAQDPDVRRLMESLAFFSARTRQAASSELRGAVHRLAHGLLDDFVHPQPARAMLRAAPTPRLTEPATLARGTRVRVETADGAVGIFSTMRDLTIRPLELDRAQLQLRGAGYRVLIRLRAFGPTVHINEPLALHVDHLGDYEASRELFDALSKHLVRVGVVYGDPPPPSDPGQDCGVAFGASMAKPAGLRDPGAIARIREFLHFPVNELCLELALARPARPWRQAWLCLDLDQWPERQAVSQHMFRLFMAPIENLFSELAEPIKCDGTRAHHSILPSRVEADVAFHSVVEVQHELKTGLELILPGHLAAGANSWELEYGEGPRDPQLRLCIPGAFLDPRMVMVRARWYQPGFAAVAVGKLEATLHSRHVEGVGFAVKGPLIPDRDSPLWGDPRAMLHVLSRRSKRVLSREDIIKMMVILGADARSSHAGVAHDLRHVEVVDEPASVERSGGIRHVYRVLLGEIEGERRGLVDDYLRCVGVLLDAWSSNPAVIRADTPGVRKRPVIVRSA